MSYIDTFDHEFIGFFGYLPVYHPLETVEPPEKPAVDFGCDPTNLVIGGGSGEHPAVVLRRPDYAVGHYIDHQVRLLQDHKPDESAALAPLVATWEDFLDKAITSETKEILYFADWDIKTYHHFYDMCCSAALHTPYNPERDGWFENWLILTLGEFVMYAMPELFPDLPSVVPEVHRILNPPHEFHFNILLVPPGYPFQYGRKRVGNTIQWGNSHWWSR